jgi:hypothetical protein
VARFDHDPVTTESLGLLIEEQRTNLVLRSEDFGNAYWLKSNATITSNTVIAPDGTLTGDKLVETISSGIHAVYKALTLTATSYTASYYMKSAERTWGFVQLSTTALGAYFDLQNGVVGTVDAGFTASIQGVGNGWYRCSVTTTATAASWTSASFPAQGNGLKSYTGDGYSGIYIWGAQLEAGAFPTSYIPTVASQVTRSADSASMTGTNFSEWYSQGEGTFYLEAQSDAPTVSGGNRYFLNVGASGNAISLLAGLISSGQAGLYVQANSSDQAYIVPASSQLLSSGQKVAGAYQTNSFQTANNGVLGTQDTSGIVPSVATMYIGRISTGATNNYLAGHIKKLSYFPARLSNEELQEMTS